MRILALQLKRLGDLVLTTPALRALRRHWPEAHLGLAVMEGGAPLLGAIPTVNTGIVFGPGRGWAPWQQVLTGAWDVCLDFTGNDRSALITALSRAGRRATFDSVQRHRLRACAYNVWSPSQVREVHTAAHYLRLASEVTGAAVTDDTSPELTLSPDTRTRAETLLREHGITGPFALLHPGTARPEKYWLPERWAELAAHLQTVHGLPSVLTCGPDSIERAHATRIQSAIRDPQSAILTPADPLALAALVERARIVISCDTVVVHFAAAFRTPQVALFGPTNPFHWRPEHARAVVLSAAQPEAPLTAFLPKMKGAPMERISTALAIRATEQALSLKF